MGLLITLLLGGIVGWLATLVMRNSEIGIFGNIVVGVLGAVLANWIIAPLVGHSAVLNHIDIVGLFIAFLGACALLALFNLATRRSVR